MFELMERARKSLDKLMVEKEAKNEFKDELPKVKKEIRVPKK